MGSAYKCDVCGDLFEGRPDGKVYLIDDSGPTLVSGKIDTKLFDVLCESCLENVQEVLS